MAITNLPYDDDLILEGVRATTGAREETHDVHVDFAGVGTSAEDVARISVTTTWTVSAADAVRILAAAIPTGDAQDVAGDASDTDLPAL